MKLKLLISILIILLVGALFYLVLTTKPKQIAPLSGRIITDEFVFEFENAEKVFISTDEDFSTQIVLEKDSKIELLPGTYYWKAKGLFGESETSNFTILSKVVLNLKEKNESFVLSNRGNQDLNVTKETNNNITYFIIKTSEEKEFEKENTSFRGEEK